MTGVRKIIEITTNLAILTVCGLLCWTLVTHKSLHFSSAGGGTHLEGQTLPTLRGYHWADHSKTLVLAIRRGCHFCESSLPFYKRLSDLEKSNALHAHLLAVMPDDQTNGEAELRSGGLIVDGVFSQPLDSLKVSGTPTLLLLDANGRVARAWVGQLQQQGEDDVISAAQR